MRPCNLLVSIAAQGPPDIVNVPPVEMRVTDIPPVRLHEPPVRADRSWRDEAAYHRVRAGQERRLAERSPSDTGARAHRAMAERHDSLAEAACWAADMPDAASPAVVQPGELLARAMHAPTDPRPADLDP